MQVTMHGCTHAESGAREAEPLSAKAGGGADEAGGGRFACRVQSNPLPRTWRASELESEELLQPIEDDGMIVCQHQADAHVTLLTPGAAG